MKSSGIWLQVETLAGLTPVFFGPGGVVAIVPRGQVKRGVCGSFLKTADDKVLVMSTWEPAIIYKMLTEVRK